MTPLQSFPVSERDQMIRHLMCAVVMGALAACVQPASKDAAAPAAPDREALIARGAYLTEKIGLCGDCHTQRLPK